MEYKLESYNDEYFETLYEMKKDNFKWYVEKIYGWDEKIQVEFQKKFIKEHRNHIKVVKYEDKVIGIFTNYVDENNESIISLFCIDKQYQKRGIGTQILKAQLKLEKQNKRNTVLQVFKENPARFLYKKVGFEIYEETKTHYKMRKNYKYEVIKNEQ